MVTETTRITEIPVTAEARETLLRELFYDELPHPGELFVPTDSFYANGLPQARAQAMLRQLCAWLGIKPGYVGLVFESTAEDHPDGTRYTIYVEQAVLHDEFVLGGFLAHSLTRYLLEERKAVRLPTPDLQTALLASATIVFGLGIVVLNGVDPVYGWIQTWRRKNMLLKGFRTPTYAFMLRNFLRAHQIVSRRYAASLTPWAAARMGQSQSPKPIHAVALARQHTKLMNLKTVGLVWLTVLILGLGVFVSLQRANYGSVEQQEALQEVTRLDQIKQLCYDALVYDRRYADLSDLQAERALNADAARCRSLDNEFKAAERRYYDLSK